MVSDRIVFDPALIAAYDRAGPRYTSYPTAAEFRGDFDEADYRRCAAAAARDGARPLSLYFHIPFCARVCFYCACSKVVTKNRQHAVTYMEYLEREIAAQAVWVGGRRVDQLHLGGGTPTFLDDEQIADLLAQVGGRFRLRDDDRGDYSIEIDPRGIDPARIAALREIGFNRISVGVQDFDPQVQTAVNRIQSFEETAGVITEARRLGFRSTNVDLIYGLPHQTPARFAGTLEQLIGLGPDRIAIYNYAHLPERFKPQRRIRAEDLPGPTDKLQLLQTAIERLTEAGYVYIGMDHFARPDDELAVAQREGTLTRNFQGYTTHGECDLVGMGLTAISSLGNCYAQNAKDLDGYYTATGAGRIPTIRGIELGRDDRIRRAVIMELICHFTLDAAAIESRFGIEFGQYFADELERLAPMEADGLIERAGDDLTVTPAGRLLIRNICMVFDRYLATARQGFSKVI